MSASPAPRRRHARPPAAFAASLHRAALAVARAGGPSLFETLAEEAATTLGAALVFVGVLDGGGTRLVCRAGWLDGEPLPRFTEPVDGLPYAPPDGADFVQGAGLPAAPGTDPRLAGHGLDAYAACRLRDSAGVPLGLLVAMDRDALPGPQRTEALLAIFAARLASELERLHADEELRAAALAVSSAQGEQVLDELVQSLARLLDVETAFIAVHDESRPGTLHRIAHVADGRPGTSTHYSLVGTPCETVVGRRFCAYAAGVAARFPDDPPLERDGIQSYAGYALPDRHGESLGIVSVMSRRPLRHLDRVEAVLQIFAVRAAAEIERLRADEALRLREEQYRLIFEAASDGFVLRDGQRRTIDANPAFYRMYGFDPAVIAAGGGYPAHFPSRYVEEREAQVQRALQGEETHVETIALRADGTPFWVDLRVVPVRYRGQPHVLQVARDISALRDREQALLRSEARLRATVDAAFDCVIGMAADGSIVEFNLAAERCFGWSRAEVLGRPLADVVIPPRHRDAHTQGLARYLQGGPGPYLGRLVETVAQRRDGTEFPIELAISVGRAPDGSIFVGHLRDISARREAERQHAELEARLRQAQKMEAIGQLTGGIAHDFNNILTSVIGYLVMAGERAEGQPRLAHPIAQAHLAAQRARELIAQMLTFARGGGRSHGVRTPVALEPALRQSLSLLRSTLPASIELEADFAPHLPAVAAEPVQVEQVLFNLCINARDAMDSAGRLRVTLRHGTVQGTCASCRRPFAGHWVELAVADDGCGLDPAVRERMFEPFYSTKEAGRGSGMGLAMVHGIVHDHGGHLRVDSAPGEGSVFRVLFPGTASTSPSTSVPALGEAAQRIDVPPLDVFADADPVLPDRHDDVGGPTDAGIARLRGRLLLVEDQPMVGAFMSELLEGWGLEVTLCRDPLRARQRFVDDPGAFDVVLTDQTMPRLTGVQLAEQLLALKPALPVLLYTGYDEGLDDAALRRRGLRGVLRKPIDPQVLRALLRECL